MPSVEHEEIVDDVLSVCNNELRKHYPGFSEPGGFGLIVEAFLAHSLMGIGYADKGPIADAYILPDDGGGPVVVEVGDMKKNKWSGHADKDGKPIRILRIGFDRSVGMLNPRFTQFERDLIECL